MARTDGIARKSIYNHPDLLEQIRSESAKPTPRFAAAAPESANELRYLSGEHTPGVRARSAPDPFAEYVEYGRLRLAADPHLWTTT